MRHCNFYRTKAKHVKVRVLAQYACMSAGILKVYFYLTKGKHATCAPMLHLYLYVQAAALYAQRHGGRVPETHAELVSMEGVGYVCACTEDQIFCISISSR